MKSNKKALFDSLSSAETKAPLTEAKPQSAAVTKKKLLNAMPVAYEDAHKKAKQAGLTGLDFSQYIYEALREKLKKDNLI